MPKEAEQVRWIFERYAALGSIGALLEEMNRLDIRTRVQTLSNGKTRGGVPYGKGALAHILKNRLYSGEIVHYGNTYKADHAPIVTEPLFDTVQVGLVGNLVERKARAFSGQFLLAGLLYDSAGNRMTPSHSRKKGVRYRYYVSQAILQSRKGQAGEVFRAPAPDLEALVERFLRNRCPGAPGDLKSLLESQIGSATVQPTYIEVSLKPPSQPIPGNPGGEATPAGAPGDAGPQIIWLPWSKKPSRAAKGVASEPSSALEEQNNTKEQLLIAIGKARRWVDQLTAGEKLEAIAGQEGRSERHIRMLLPLAFVAPVTVRAIISDRIPPPGVTQMAKNIPLNWEAPKRIGI